MFPSCLNVNGMQAVGTGWVHHQRGLIWTIHKEVDVKITTIDHLKDKEKNIKWVLQMQAHRGQNMTSQKKAAAITQFVGGNKKYFNTYSVELNAKPERDPA